MARLRVNSIVNRNDNSTVQLSYGATVPSGQLLSVQGNLNISGIATVGFLTSQNANITGVVTATTFSGNGSGLTNIPVVSASKSIALKILLDPLPYRS